MNNIHKAINMVTLIKRSALFLSLFLLSAMTQAEQVTFDVGKFSERYYAKVTVNYQKLDEVFRPGTIRVYDGKHPKTPIITIESEELTFDVDNGKTGANVHELPYGTHSLLIYEDFNFDGKKDLALMDGQNSCYHGPSFQVYLANSKGGFTQNSEFTRLAQEYCGFFDTDAKTKTIAVMTKSGCCWHLYETYKVVGGNNLRRIYSITESTSGFYSGGEVINSRGKREKTTVRYTLGDDNEKSIIFQFKLKSAPHKEVVLLLGGEADYALLNRKNNLVEYSYALAAKGILPPGKKEHENILTFDAKNNSICSGIGDTSYTVIDQPKRLGVLVKQGRRVTFLAGKPDTRNGDLTEIQTADNVKPGSCPLK